MKKKAIPSNQVLDQTEIINLTAIQQLPKATEHFISDLHGEFEAFDHLKRNCSGIISIKVAELFNGVLTQEQQKELCFSIYYPEEFIEGKNLNQDEWLILLNRLVKVTRHVSSKYTRSKVRKALPKQYAYILEELLYQYDQDTNKQDYYDAIFQSIIDLNLASDFASSLAHLVQTFVVDHLHILGDIYDRGSHPDAIIDALMDIPSIDIQLGNHDIIWIGAYSGSLACLAVALRISLRYGHTRLLEEGYEIDLSRLRKFARETYHDNLAFRPRGNGAEGLNEENLIEITKMHQAIAIIQFKLEGQLIHRRPEFGMENRSLLGKISPDHQTIFLEGQTYPLENPCFEQIDPEHPNQLTLTEELVILDLLNQLQRSKRFKKHIDFLMNKGHLYLTYNNNLLFHGCLPCDGEGEFLSFSVKDKELKGRDLMDHYFEAIQEAYKRPEQHEDYVTDLIWYLWCGPASSLFGKKTMKTFKRYFLSDKETHKEIQNPYYELRNNVDFCKKVLAEFDLGPQGYIVNGHTPVKALKGENPIKAEGKMLVIDGGLSRAYQKVTGIAGYTLVDNSHEVYLVAHHPFTSRQHAIANLQDPLPDQALITKRPQRVNVGQTDIGQELEHQIQVLKEHLP